MEAHPVEDVVLSGHFMAGIIFMTVLAVLTAWLRMYTRIFVSRKTWWDDWTMFAASVRNPILFLLSSACDNNDDLIREQLVTCVTNAFLIKAYHHGLGRHIQYVDPEEIPRTFMWLWAAEPTNLFAVFLVRLSICLFFLRLVPRKTKVYGWVIWITIVALTASDLYISIDYFFECRPIRKVWLPTTRGNCFPPLVTEVATWLFQGMLDWPDDVEQRGKGLAGC